MTVATRSWRLWSTTAQVTVTNPKFLAEAVAIARESLEGIERASSRFRADSELESLRGKLSAGVTVSPRLASLVRSALDVADRTDGTVDPTLGNDLIRLGYDRDIASLPSAAESVPEPFTIITGVPRPPGWRRVSLVDRLLTVPDDLALDLGASAKAVAADECAHSIFERLGCGVLVSLGGDIATAGTEPTSGWDVLVQDLPNDPAQTVRIVAGTALATSSTQKRQWVRGERPQHHILDPRFGLPAAPFWKSVSIAAESCLAANALSTAVVVKGHGALGWLRDSGAAGRLVDHAGRVITVGDWPSPPEASVPL